MKKHHNNIDNENAMEYNKVNESTAYSNVRRIIFLFSGLFFIGIGCAIFYYVGSEGLIAGLLPLILGFFLIKEVFFPYNKKEKGGLLGKPGTFSRKANVGCLTIICVLLLLLGLIYGPSLISYKSRGYDSEAKADIKNAYTASQAYFTAYPTGTVSLSKLTSYGYVQSSKVTLTVLSGSQSNLRITSFHTKGTKTYTIDSDGNISSQEAVE